MDKNPDRGLAAPAADTGARPGGGTAGASAAPPRHVAARRGSEVVLVETFNRILKKFICDLAARYPADPTIVRAKKRVVLVLDVEPLYAINAVGPYLYEYREQIACGDERFFIENDYDAELRQGVDAGRVDLVTYLIPKIKEAWGAIVDPAEQRVYKESVQDLLDNYVEYLALKLRAGSGQ